MATKEQVDTLEATALAKIASGELDKDNFLAMIVSMMASASQMNLGRPQIGALAALRRIYGEETLQKLLRSETDEQSELED